MYTPCDPSSKTKLEEVIYFANCTPSRDLLHENRAESKYQSKDHRDIHQNCMRFSSKFDVSFRVFSLSFHLNRLL